MTEPLSSPLAQFPWISKRDGRLVPFDADKISRSLFAATEALGQPDAFLARELTDAVLHFLAAEADGSIPTTAQVADTVAKVVRELGQPRLAQEFALHRQKRPPVVAEPSSAAASPDHDDTLFTAIRRDVEAGTGAAELARNLSRTCLRVYSLRSLFSRDLVAAHHDGLLILGNLHTPLELAGCVLPLTTTEFGPGQLTEWITATRSHVGELLAFDGPEYLLLDAADRSTRAGQYARELGLGLAMTGLRAIVNLNTAQPPTWAGDPAEGPLFANQRRPPEPAQLADSADVLLEALRPLTAVRIDWHLGERDFAPETTARLARLVRYASDQANLAFVFDRPRRPVALAEGLDRRHAAVLLTIGLNLPRLAEHPRLGGDMIPKLGSLVRMALSAAVQKREFLRRHSHGRPALTRGFLLQRARFVLAPVGLEAMTQRLHGRGLCDGGPALDFAREVIQQLRETLRQDAAAHHLDACLDAPASFSLDGIETPAVEQIAGSTVWDVQPSARHQLRTASVLQAVSEMGTAAVLVSTEQTLATEELVEWLRYAWQKTDIVRLRLVRAASAVKQLTAPWET